MSTTEERARALVWAGGFLVQISRDSSLPLELRRQATVIARHFPTIEDVGRLPAQVDLLVPGVGRLSQGVLETWRNDLVHGPLTDRTRLRWPD
ncbi:MAG TPA: BPSL0761 family protein [Arenimonas sp.]